MAMVRLLKRTRGPQWDRESDLVRARERLDPPRLLKLGQCGVLYFVS
jgi:hypothetical protein